MKSSLSFICGNCKYKLRDPFKLFSVIFEAFLNSWRQSFCILLDSLSPGGPGPEPRVTLPLSYISSLFNFVVKESGQRISCFQSWPNFPRQKLKIVVTAGESLWPERWRWIPEDGEDKCDLGSAEAWLLRWPSDIAQGISGNHHSFTGRRMLAEYPNIPASGADVVHSSSCKWSPLSPGSLRSRSCRAGPILFSSSPSHSVLGIFHYMLGLSWVCHPVTDLCHLLAPVCHTPLSQVPGSPALVLILGAQKLIPSPEWHCCVKAILRQLESFFETVKQRGARVLYLWIFALMTWG